MEAISAIVGAASRARVLGSGHSFSTITDTIGDLISVAGLPERLEIAPDRSSVTVSAGMRYGEIAKGLQAEGLALHNLASLPHISVAGAVATGTHGSGTGNGSLATAVMAIEMITADGRSMTLTRQLDGDRFAGSVVALGCLGVVVAMTLEVQPTFDVRQVVYEGLPVGRLATDLRQILAAGYSVSLFTSWGDDVIDHVWVKSRVDGPTANLGASWMDARRSTREWHPIARLPPDACTTQSGVPGPWHDRLPHFRPEYMPSSGDELQSEYLVPLEVGAHALQSVYRIRHKLRPVLQVCEIRAVAADDLWLSPAFGADVLGIHFTWLPDTTGVMSALEVLEEQLAPFDARPHWGKVFAMPPARLQALYPRLNDFRALRREIDPSNVFGNDLVDTYAGR